MKARTLVTILLKLMGLYVFMHFLLMLPSSLAARSASVNATNDFAPSLGSMFLFLWRLSFAYLVFSISLFFTASKLSRFIVEKHDNEVILSGEVTDGMQTWVFRCFGVYALITWGPNLVQTLCRTIIYGTWQLDEVPLVERFYDNWSILIGPAVGVVLGLLLIFKAKGLMRLIQLSRPMSRQRIGLEDLKEHLQPDSGEERR
ncbi:MAG: hypothetical protein GXY42_06925 [Desulfovibrionales bacterium]|nr:hypothetical protein [Desulfovibrionales bacterium]